MPTPRETICMQSFLGWLSTHGEPVSGSAWQWLPSGEGGAVGRMKLVDGPALVGFSGVKGQLGAGGSPGILVLESSLGGGREPLQPLEVQARSAGLLQGWFELTLRAGLGEEFSGPAAQAALQDPLLQGLRELQAQPERALILRIQGRQVAYLVKVADAPERLEITRLEEEFIHAPAMQARTREMLRTTLRFQAQRLALVPLASEPPDGRLPLLVLFNTNPWADPNLYRQCLDQVPERQSFQAIFSVSLERICSLVYSQLPRWSYETELEEL